MQLTNLITQYGYLAVFVLMLAESACIPVPSEVIMMFGGALAAGAIGSGTPPSLLGVVAAGVLGNVAGSYLAWAVGKYAGRAAIGRWGRRFGIREHEIDRAAAWFERHGPVAVLVGRVIPVIRTFISLPAGFAGMPASRFGLYTALGCIPWTAALGIAGYALGANWEHVANDFHGPTYAIAGILVVAVVVLVVRRRRAVKGERPGPSAGALAGQPPPSRYAREPQGAYGSQGGYGSRDAGPRDASEQQDVHGSGDAYGPRRAYGPQDAYGQQDAYGSRGAYRPEGPRSPRDVWSGSPEEPWAQPSGRPNR